MQMQQEKIAKYIVGRTVNETCTGTEMNEGSSRFLRWRDQEHGPTQAEREVEYNRNSVYCKIIKYDQLLNHF